jgi:hypothetical protein
MMRRSTANIETRATQQTVVIFVQRRISWRDGKNEVKEQMRANGRSLQKPKIFFMIWRASEE